MGVRDAQIWLHLNARERKIGPIAPENEIRITGRTYRFWYSGFRNWYVPRGSTFGIATVIVTKVETKTR